MAPSAPQRCRWGRCLTVASCVVAVVADGPVAPGLVWSVNLQLSTGRSLPLAWNANRLAYSLAVPNDAPYVAVGVALFSREGSSNRTFVLDVPSINLTETYRSGELSRFVDVDTRAPTLLQFSIADSDYYRISVIRSKVSSNGQGVHPDPARSYPPQGTLAGLSIWDSTGATAKMPWFLPRQSLYYASISVNAEDVQLAATPNDPHAELAWRLNGGKWDYLISGLSSPFVGVSANGWSLVELRVNSAAAAALSPGLEPLVYQVAVTKDKVCHPKCRTCGGPDEDDCTSCVAPLVLHHGKCLYTACRGRGLYFNAELERCEKCHSTCLECDSGDQWGCTVCPPLTFLSTTSVLDVKGQCVAACQIGYFVQPASQRCQRATTDLIERFYIKLELRITLDEFLEKPRMVQTLLRVSADTLAVSPQDVRFVKWEASGDSVDYILQVETPFLGPSDVRDGISIDTWFASFPVPVDIVTVLSHAELYPQPSPPRPDPLIAPWMWALAASLLSICLILYPMYNFYFIRMHFQKTNYKPKRKKEREFVTEVLDKAPHAIIHAAAREADRPA